MLILPNQILQKPEEHRLIKVDDFTVVESCLYGRQLNDSAFLTEHELIYILSGSLTVNEMTIESGQAIFIRKDSYFDFSKNPSPKEDSYKSILFFLKNEFIKEFISSKLNFIEPELKNDPLPTKEKQNFIKLCGNPLLEGFVHSLMPYFGHHLGRQKSIIRLKTFELLYQLAATENGFLDYLLYLNQDIKPDLTEIMENNYTKKLTIEQLAAMSGRSISTFKRDFKKRFQNTPMRWIKSRRLKLARQLLQHSNRKPIDIYLDVGFEDYAHFSKEFKKKFGFSPNEFRSELFSHKK